MTDTNINSNNLGELLKSYYQGTISDEKGKGLESLASQDEFLADAMEGFKEFPSAASSIPSLKTGSSVKIWLTIGSFLIAASIGIFFFYSIPNASIENEKITQITPIVIENKEEIKALPIPENKTEIIVPITKIKKKIKKIQKPILKETKLSEREYFEIPKMELTPMETQEKEKYTLKKSKTKALAYFNFLAIDYSVIYTNTIPVETKLSGIDASKANPYEIGVEATNGIQSKTITYKEQLKTSLFYLKEQNYPLAIENFEIILSHFPQDANAQFYIGYALYYQKQYEEAIEYFDKTMENSFDFFMEDSEWFKANSLENNGHLKEAQAIYRKIKNKGGYYSYQVR